MARMLLMRGEHYNRRCGRLRIASGLTVVAAHYMMASFRLSAHEPPRRSPPWLCVAPAKIPGEALYAIFRQSWRHGFHACPYSAIGAAGDINLFDASANLQSKYKLIHITFECEADIWPPISASFIYWPIILPKPRRLSRHWVNGQAWRIVMPDIAWRRRRHAWWHGVVNIVFMVIVR